jgi:hypothetical protein
MSAWWSWSPCEGCQEWPCVCDAEDVGSEPDSEAAGSSSGGTPMSGERFLMPRNYGPEHEAAMIAITARLRPIAESPTTRLVEVTYWRDGSDLPLTKVVFDTHTVVRWRRNAPIDATHLTIEERAWPARAPWRFDVPEVPAHVTAMEVEGCLIVRVPGMPSVPGGWWKQRFSDGTVDNAKPLSVWLQFAPLVECPDPRATT